MINQNVDYALVGNNYMSFLLSHSSIRKGKKVLLLDDDRFNYGDFFSNSLTQLDLDVISVIGEKFNHENLKNIRQYIKVVPKVFYVGKIQVKLGGTPFENLRELQRKLPQFFSLDVSTEGDQFNTDYQSYCESVAQKLILTDKKNNLYAIIENNLPFELKKILERFMEHFNPKNNSFEVENNVFRTFIYLFRGYFQNRLSISGSRLEIYHMLLSLLSPYYELDYVKLNIDLLQTFVSSGGEFKKLNIGELKLQSSNIKGIDLESYEGTIFPKKIIFVGGHPNGMPLSFNIPRNLYYCLQVELWVESIPEILKNQKIVFSSPMKISTDYPMFEIQFIEKKMIINMVISKRNGTKIDFIKKSILDELHSDLKYLYPEFDFKVQNAQFEFSNDIFIEDKDFKSFELKEKKSSDSFVDIIFSTRPLMFKRPKNVYYLGPYNDGLLGTFSSLIEVWRWQEKM